MSKSLYYKIWVRDKSANTWTEVREFWDASFDRGLGSSGNLTFKTTATGTWADHLTGSDNEDNHVKVTHRFEIDATTGTQSDTEVTDPTSAQGAGNAVVEVDDFVVRNVDDDIVGAEDIEVRCATFEQLMKDLSIPDRLYYSQVEAHKIVTSGNDVAPPSDGEINSSNIGSSPGILEMERQPNDSADFLVAGDIDTSTSNVTTTIDHHVEGESPFHAIQRLNDKVGTYVRCRRSDDDTVQVDYYDRVEGGTITRHYTPGSTDPTTSSTKTEGLILTQSGEDLPDGFQLTLGVNVQNLRKTSDREPKADQVSVVGGSDAGYQKIGTSSSSGTGFKQDIMRFPEATDQATVDQLATNIKDVWDSAEVGQRFSAVAFNSLLYSNGFQAELGDIVGVVDYDSNEFRGKFVRYSYDQAQESHTYDLEFTGTNVERQIAQIISEKDQDIKNRQGRPNWTNPDYRGSNVDSGNQARFEFQVPDSSKEVGDANLFLSAATQKTDKGTVQGSHSGDVGGESGTGTANVTEDNTWAQSITTESSSDGGVNTTIGPRQVGTPSFTASGSFNAGTNGVFSFRLSTATSPGPSRMAIVRVFIDGVLVGGDEIMGWDPINMSSDYISNGGSNDDLLGTVQFDLPFATTNPSATVEIFNVSHDLDVEVQGTLKFNKRDFSHLHNAADTGHDGHLDGTYELDDNVASTTGGGSATSATVDVYLDKKDGTFALDSAHRIANDITIPTDGKTITIPVGSSGSQGEIDTSSAGKSYGLVIVPQSDIFIAIATNLETQVEG